jgi:hypothetical protein
MNMRNLFLIAAAIALVGAAGGCAKPRPSHPPLKIRLGVLDLLPPGGGRSAKDYQLKQREGWWFGSKDVIRDPNVSIRVADQLASRLNRMDYLTVDSRYDFRIYMQNKKDQLVKKFPKLTKTQIDELALKTVAENPAEVGREFQDDRVLTGEIVDERMDHNRFLQTWSSKLAVHLKLIDVGTGKVVFDRVFSKSVFAGSPDSVAEELANDVAEWMANEYGY